MEETFNDTPRLKVNAYSPFQEAYGIQDPEEMNVIYMTLLEHSRVPGTFDYTQPQTRYSLFPDIDQEAYVEIGGNQHRKLRISDSSI